MSDYVFRAPLGSTVFVNAEGKAVVEIKADGSVVVREGYSPTAVADLFWERVGSLGAAHASEIERLRAENERLFETIAALEAERDALREALRVIESGLRCGPDCADDSCARDHYCPNCDQSMFRWRDAAIRALA